MRPIVLTILLGATLLGCRKEGCTQFGAENYDVDATLDDGSCILVRDKFLGNFQVSSNCFADDYQRTIETTTDQYLVTISNMADTLGTVEAHVWGKDIVIDRQTVRTGVTVEGAGVYVEENDAISLTFRIRDTRSGTEIINDCAEWCTKF